MDIFDDRSAKVMLTGREGPAFDDPDYIFEIKLDGDRCLAYLSDSETVLINRHGRYLAGYLPELASLHTQVSKRCVLDGELIIGSGYKHEFERLRSRLSRPGSVRFARESHADPATFLAFDLLYLEDRDILNTPLLERKALLQQNVDEGPRLALSRYIPEQGKRFFELVTAQGLEGIMAKKVNSVYRMGKRSLDWMKCKNWDRDVFVICGYVPSEKANVVSLVLGQYQEGALTFASYVMLGRKNAGYTKLTALEEREAYMDVPWEGGKRGRIIWVEPVLVCEVEFICRTSTGGLRQPIFKGMRTDMTPEHVLWPESVSCQK